MKVSITEKGKKRNALKVSPHWSHPDTTSGIDAKKTCNPGQKKKKKEITVIFTTVVKQLQDCVLAVSSTPTHCGAILLEAENVAPRICKHRKCLESLNFNQLIIKR